MEDVWEEVTKKKGKGKVAEHAEAPASQIQGWQLSAIAPKPPRQASSGGGGGGKKHSPRPSKQHSTSNGNLSGSGGGGGGGGGRATSKAPTPSKKVYKARKKLIECEALQAKLEGGAALNADQQKKLGTLPALWAALAEAEAALTAEEEAKVAAEQKSKAALQATLCVEFDDAFACAICQELLQAATIVKTCKHVFCRACIEALITKSKKKSHCVCPLCRTPLFKEGIGGVVERVELKPAKDVKKRMAKKTGKCHCGEEMSLNKLNEHLRACGSAANHYVGTRKFTCDYVKPDFTGDQPVMSSDGDVEQAIRLSLSTYFDELNLRESESAAGGAAQQ